jgi:hypothetical protein
LRYFYSLVLGLIGYDYYNVIANTTTTTIVSTQKQNNNCGKSCNCVMLSMSFTGQ